LTLTGTVTTNQASYTVTKSGSWLTLSRTTGTNGTELTITAAANTSTSARSGYVTITSGTATYRINVTQSGAPAATVSFSGGSTWYPPANATLGSLTLTGTVTTNQASYTVTKSVSWLTLSATTGTSGTTLTITAAANTSTSSRSGYVTITARTATYRINVTQSGAPAATVSFSGGSAWYPPANATLGSLTLTGTVTTNQASYTVTKSGSWLTLSRTTGTNGTELTVTAAANTSTSSRSGYFTITSGTATYRVTVIQSGAPAATVSFSGGSTWSAPANTSGGSLTLTGTVTTNQGSWSASRSVTWLTLSLAGGTNGSPLTITAAANTSTSSRSGYVTLTAGTATYRITVTQAGVSSQATVSFNPVYGYGSYGNSTWYAPAYTSYGTAVYASGPVATNQSAWTVAVNASPWLSVSPTTGGTNGSTLTITAQPNTTGQSRAGYVVIYAGTAYQIVQVSQSAG
jgi:hypothetical protein